MGQLFVSSGRCGRAGSFLDCLRHFLTPAVWKQGHRRLPRGRAQPRWALQPLVLVLLTMTWGTGDSQAERFETAKAFALACRPKRRRPGHSVQGWQMALARLPTAALRGLAAALRRRLEPWLAQPRRFAGFIPLGGDGTRLECPRSAELEARLGKANKDHAAPTRWLTALVQLRSGLLWAWRLGKGTASEREHLRRLLTTLPAAALVVADAGYQGYQLAAALVHANVAFLIRVSSQSALYRVAGPPVRAWRDGTVYCWPQAAQEHDQPALLLRLMRVRGRRKKNDVWLLSNVLTARRLSVTQAGQLYRWRWESEGFFRTCKRTLAMVKLRSRTVRLVHREAEGALVATQLLLAQGAQALACQAEPAARTSPRRVLREIRRELAAVPRPRPRGPYAARLAQAQREQRRRASRKEKRAWPRRRDQTAPKAPRLLRLTKQHKAQIARQNQLEEPTHRYWHWEARPEALRRACATLNNRLHCAHTHNPARQGGFLALQVRK